ncbi:MAG: hypothetical protein ACR2PF_13715 [Rhizobiaceae bacterium]
MRDEHQRQLASVRDDLAASGYGRREVDDFAVGIVPFMNREIVPADRERQAGFLTNLRSFLNELFDPNYEEQKVHVGYGPPELEDVRIAACTACRGSCCNQAETHAFLHPKNLERLVDRNNPEALENAMALYEGHLPDESVKDSCVFHTATGCALPREHRSQTCNSWRCPKLRAIETFATSADGETLLLAAVLDDELRNVQTVEVSLDV